MKKRITFLTIILLSSYLYCSTGNIAGRITEQSTKATVPGVNIYIDDEMVIVASESGEYIIKNIPVGSHKITYKRIGFKTRTKLNVTIKPNHTIMLNIELENQPILIDGGIASTEEVFFRETESAPVSSSTMEIEEIQSQPSGSYDVQRVVQALPSVLTISDGDNEIISRGGSTGENLFILDNIEIPNPNHFGKLDSGGGPISMIIPEYVKEVNFYAGAFPAKFGSKTSSVMEIKTRNGNKHKLHLKLDAGFMGYGAIAEGPLPNKKGTFLASFQRSFISLIADNVGLNAVPEYDSFFGKQVIDFNPYLSLTLHQLWAKDKMDIVQDRENMEEDDTLDNEEYVRCGRYVLGATLKNIHSFGYSLLTLAHNEQHVKSTIYDVEEIAESSSSTESEYSLEKEFKIDNQEKYYSAKYSMTIPTEKLGMFEFGFKGSMEEATSSLFMLPDTSYVYHTVNNEIIIDDTLYHNLGDDNVQDSKITAAKYSGYLQWEKQIKKFKLNLGIRSDYLDYTDDVTISPRIGVSYSLLKDTEISMGLGRHYQFPEYHILSNTSKSEDSFANEKNKELESKFTDQIILGFSKIFREDVKLSIETYYKKYDNVPIRYSDITAELQDQERYYVNEGGGYSRGVEFFLQKKVKDNIWGTMSYALSEAKAIDPREGKKKDIEYDWDFDIRHTFTGIIGYKFFFMDKNWYNTHRVWMKYFGILGLFPGDESEISAKLKYSSGKPYTQQTYDEVNKSWDVSHDEKFNSERFPAYTRLDIHLKHIWFYNKYSFGSYLEIDNLLDRENIDEYVYNDDNGTIEEIHLFERTFVAGFIFEF